MGFVIFCAAMGLLGVLFAVLGVWGTIGLFVLGLIGWSQWDNHRSGNFAATGSNTTPGRHIPVHAMQVMQSEVQSGLQRLSALQVFSPTDPALLSAWNSRSRERIEILLKAGDSLTRQSWEVGTALVNKAYAWVDECRGNLRWLVMESERLLTRYIIDETGMPFDRSAILELEVTRLVTKKSIPKRVDFTRGVAQLGGRVAVGQTSWQAAAVGLAFGVVAHQMNKSKALRKLKELEGLLASQAADAAGDLSVFATIVDTQILPNMSALIRLCATIEGQIAELQTVELENGIADLPPKAALRLSMAKREAQYYLDRAAGK